MDRKLKQALKQKVLEGLGTGGLKRNQSSESSIVTFRKKLKLNESGLSRNHRQQNASSAGLNL